MRLILLQAGTNLSKKTSNVIRMNSPAVKTELAQTRTRCQGDSSRPAERWCQRPAAPAADKLDATGCESCPGTEKEKKKIYPVTEKGFSLLGIFCGEVRKTSFGLSGCKI